MHAAMAGVEGDVIESYRKKLGQLRAQRAALRQDVLALQSQAATQQGMIEDLHARIAVQCRGESRC